MPLLKYLLGRAQNAVHTPAGRAGRVIAALTSFALTAGPAPADEMPAHAHGPNFTSWERDGDLGVGVRFHNHIVGAGIENGDEAHQHYINQAFLGPDPNGSFEPFGVYGAWINRRAFVDGDVPFTSQDEYRATRVGHGFIDERSAANLPRYRFGPGFPDAAKLLVQEAFLLWGGVMAQVSPATGQALVTGIGFAQTADAAREIDVLWENINDNSNGGAVPVFPEGTYDSTNRVLVRFDSHLANGDPFPWDFTASAALSDLTRFHFLSVALHELGHLMFLEHSQNQEDDLMTPVVGAPLGAAAGSRSYRWSGYTENPGENDGFTGVRFTRNADGSVATRAIFDHDSADAIKSLYSMPTAVPEPSALVLGLAGLCGLGAIRLRRRRSRALWW